MKNNNQSKTERLIFNSSEKPEKNDLDGTVDPQVAEPYHNTNRKDGNFDQDCNEYPSIRPLTSLKFTLSLTLLYFLYQTPKPPIFTTTVEIPTISNLNTNEQSDVLTPQTPLLPKKPSKKLFSENQTAPVPSDNTLPSSISNDKLNGQETFSTPLQLKYSDKPTPFTPPFLSQIFNPDELSIQTNYPEIIGGSNGILGKYEVKLNGRHPIYWNLYHTNPDRIRTARFLLIRNPGPDILTFAYEIGNYSSANFPYLDLGKSGKNRVIIGTDNSYTSGPGEALSVDFLKKKFDPKNTSLSTYSIPPDGKWYFLPGPDGNSYTDLSESPDLLSTVKFTPILKDPSASSKISLAAVLSTTENRITNILNEEVLVERHPTETKASDARLSRYNGVTKKNLYTNLLPNSPELIIDSSVLGFKYSIIYNQSAWATNPYPKADWLFVPGQADRNHGNYGKTLIISQKFINNSNTTVTLTLEHDNLDRSGGFVTTRQPLITMETTTDDSLNGKRLRNSSIKLVTIRQLSGNRGLNFYKRILPPGTDLNLNIVLPVAPNTNSNSGFTLKIEKTK